MDGIMCANLLPLYTPYCTVQDSFLDKPGFPGAERPQLSCGQPERSEGGRQLQLLVIQPYSEHDRPHRSVRQRSQGSVRKTPSACVRHETQFASKRYGGIIGPGGAVQWNPSCRSNRQRPRGSHARTQPTTPKRLSGLNTCRRRGIRTPSAEAHTDRIPILDDRKHRRPARSNLARYPPSKVALKPPLLLNDYDIGGPHQRLRKRESWPAGLPYFDHGLVS